MKGHIVFYDSTGTTHLRFLTGLFTYLNDLGYEATILTRDPSEERLREALADAPHLFVWNGDTPWSQRVKNIARELAVEMTFVEVGWLPQRTCLHLDRKGINGNSSLVEDTLSWITPKHLDELNTFRTCYLNGRSWRQTNKYILVPLQLEGDTNIKLHSPFHSMQQFIDHVEERFPGEKIIFKKHPRDPRRQYKSRNRIVYGGSILDLAQDASQVYGINSTSLFETALLGVPTTPVGEGILKAHLHEPEQALAAIISRQRPINWTDYGAFFEELNINLPPFRRTNLPPLLSLDVGCGIPGPQEGYHGVDIHPNPHLSFQCSAIELGAHLPPDSVTQIYSWYGLQRLSYTDISSFLRIAQRLLIHGGKLRIIVPDLAYHLDQLLSQNTWDMPSGRNDGRTYLEQALGSIYGWEELSEKERPHKSGFTFPLLSRVLQEHFFTHIVRQDSDPWHLDVSCSNNKHDPEYESWRLLGGVLANRVANESTARA